MIYPQNFEQKIGFDQIRQLLKEKMSQYTWRRTGDRHGILRPLWRGGGAFGPSH